MGHLTKYTQKSKHQFNMYHDTNEITNNHFILSKEVSIIVRLLWDSYRKYIGYIWDVRYTDSPSNTNSTSNKEKNGAKYFGTLRGEQLCSRWSSSHNNCFNLKTVYISTIETSWVIVTYVRKKSETKRFVRNASHKHYIWNHTWCCIMFIRFKER